VTPDRFFDVLPEVIREVAPLPGEGPPDGLIRDVLSAADQDSAIKDILGAVAVEADRDLIGPLFAYSNEGVSASNGWGTLDNAARCGTDYITRAQCAGANIFANRPEESAYFFIDRDPDGTHLTGEKTYKSPFPADQLPPVKGFWSVTLYDKHHFFAPNDHNRFSIGTKNRDLAYGADGTLTIYVQHQPPDSDKVTNWLRAPQDEFSLFVRTYWPTSAALTEGYHLTVDLTDKAIEFVQDAKAIAPDKPSFLYYCPGAAHAPHHAPKEWADKYQGKFDMGYEAYREQVFQRQQQLGIIPEGAELSPINPYTETTSHDGKPWSELDTVRRPWGSLSDDERRLFARMAEVYAGFLSHADHELGRLLDYLEESGQLDNTIIVLVSDNGSSGEGGPNGSVNENKFFNGVPDTIEENLKYLDELGGPSTFNHYPNGWAWAFNTPFKMWKRYSNYEGGTADPLIVSWPDGIAGAAGPRRQYCHAVDIVPTLLECLGVELPDVVNGYTQKPLEGVSFKPSFDNADEPTQKQTQFYSMLGTRAIWHQGWKAATAVPAAPDSWGDFHQQRWELFDTQADPSECHDLAEQYPEKLQELMALWWAEAGKYQALPLESRGAVEILTTERPQLSKPRTRYVYFSGGAEVPESVAPNIRNRSYTIAAEMDIETPEAGGVIFSQGSRFGGHAPLREGWQAHVRLQLHR
jgi:arylsulfatase A-like enzyme